MENRIIELGNADFNVDDVVYVIGLEYLFVLVMLWDWFKLFKKYVVYLKNFRESSGGKCLFSGHLIDVINIIIIIIFIYWITHIIIADTNGPLKKSQTCTCYK